MRDAGNEYGATTGRPRRCGWFDAVAVRTALDMADAESLVVTNLDVLSGFEELQVGVTYEIGGKTWEQVPVEVARLDDVRVTYRSFSGWNEDISSARSFEDLPDATRGYVEALEGLIGRPISMLSVGPERDQVISRGL